jgi:hypothetical protein
VGYTQSDRDYYYRAEVKGKVVYYAECLGLAVGVDDLGAWMNFRTDNEPCVRSSDGTGLDPREVEQVILRLYSQQEAKEQANMYSILKKLPLHIGAKEKA